MTRYRVVSIAVLLVLAGCSGYFPAGEDGGTARSPFDGDDELQTPTNRTENPSGETAPDSLAPGLTTEGIENATLLLEHHFDVLERESANGTYVATRRSTTTENGTLVHEDRSQFVVEYPRRWSQSRTIERNNLTETSHHEYWVDDTVAAHRYEESDGTVGYQVLNHTEPPGHPGVFEGQSLARELSTVPVSRDDVTVTERTRDATTWYVVTVGSDGVSNDPVTPTENTTVIVREDGFVERIETRAVTEYASRGTEVTTSRWEFETAPNETLERPDWYEEAREAATDENE